ncbi:MAG: SRPBCC family protein [Burkholderiales bacterium]|nr:SRPBCC family protein [Burkholderiales bacterium]
MRLLRKSLAGFVILVAVLAIVGLLLPAHFKVERSIVIKAKPEDIYAQLDDPKAWKAWSIWVRRDPAMQIAYGDVAHGVGAHWSWRSKTEGNGAMTFTASDPGKLLTYKLEFPDYGMVSTGVLRLEPATDGVKLTWNNEGDMDHNPMNRYMGLFMDKMVGPDFDAGLAQLKQNLEH